MSFLSRARQQAFFALLNYHQRQEALGVLGLPQSLKGFELELVIPAGSASGNAAVVITSNGVQSQPS